MIYEEWSEELRHALEKKGVSKAETERAHIFWQEAFEDRTEAGIIFAAAWHSSSMPEGAISSRTISGLKRHFPLFCDRTICMQRQAAQGAIPHAASAISCMFRI